jgi:phosphonoacetaldehyde hydrolase
MSFPIKAVVFDWAGTMVDFGCMAPVEALVEAFAAEGVALTDAEARRDMGRAKRDHVAAILADAGVAARWRTARGVEPGPDDVERVYHAVEPLMVKAAARSARLIPGALETFRRLKAQGVKIGSGTGYTREMMDAILVQAAEQGYAPDCVVCAGETPSGRPSPLMTWQALVTLDVWPASAVVKVDDAPVGIEEGVSAGCWTVGLAASGNGVGLSLADYSALSPQEQEARKAVAASELRAAGAHFVIDSVADLWSVLETIAARIGAGEGPACIR